MNTKDKVKLEELIKIPLDYSYIMLFLTANKMQFYRPCPIQIFYSSV